jgi:DNA-binding LacI/PurR family transcriptional regulator
MAVTMTDVAQAAGVSTSTVSRVFATPQAVRKQTRDMVLTAAQSLGFTPGRVPGPPGRDRALTLGVVVPDIADPRCAQIVKAAQNRARHAECAVLLADADERPRDEYELALAMTGQVDGLLLVEPRMTAEQQRNVAAAMPTVLVGTAGDGLCAVLAGTGDGMRQALAHLAELGHTRIRHVDGARPLLRDEERAALRRAAAELGADLAEHPGPFGADATAGAAAADGLLATGATALIAHGDRVALGAARRLAELGVAVPGDVSLVSVGDTFLARATHPHLTCVHVPLDHMAGTAVDILLRRADQPPHTPAEAVTLPTSLIVRDSTAGAPRPR